MDRGDRIIAFTDGSTQYNPGVGGYASVIVDHDKENIIHQHSEFLEITTNNQAELLATIYSVEWFIKNYDSDKYLVVMSDSKYCTIGFNDRVDFWATKDWRTVKGDYIKNLLLWKRLYNLKKERRDNIFFQWVKGHSGNKFNELADNLCRGVWQQKLKELKNE